MNDQLVYMFVNGQAMTGGSLHDALSVARLVGPIMTAPRYRFFSFQDEFPGLMATADTGVSITGELYEVSYQTLMEQLLPREPEELELSIIALADGSHCLSMVVRAGQEQGPGVVDISDFGGWRAYRARPEAH